MKRDSCTEFTVILYSVRAYFISSVTRTRTIRYSTVSHIPIHLPYQARNYFFFPLFFSFYFYCSTRTRWMLLLHQAHSISVHSYSIVELGAAGVYCSHLGRFVVDQVIPTNCDFG